MSLLDLLMKSAVCVCTLYHCGSRLTRWRSPETFEFFSSRSEHNAVNELSLLLLLLHSSNDRGVLYVERRLQRSHSSVIRGSRVTLACNLGCGSGEQHVPCQFTVRHAPLLPRNSHDGGALDLGFAFGFALVSISALWRGRRLSSRRRERECAMKKRRAERDWNRGGFRRFPLFASFRERDEASVLQLLTIFSSFLPSSLFIIPFHSFLSMRAKFVCKTEIIMAILRLHWVRKSSVVYM